MEGMSDRAYSGGAMAKRASAKRGVADLSSDIPGSGGPAVRARNMSVACRRVTVGQIPEHAHPTLQINILFEPASCVLLWPAKAGAKEERTLIGPALVMVAPGQPHSWDWQRPGDVIVLQLDQRARQRLAHESTEPVIVAAPLAARDLMVWQFANVLRQLCFAADAAQLPLLGLVAESVATRIASVIRQAVTAPERSLTAILLQKIEDFVRAQLAYDIHIDDLARCVGYSVPHFSELFKGAMGMTPADYIFERRMSRAEELLRTGNYLIGEVARLVGYFDQGHFTGVFREHFGYAPKLVLQQARAVSANRPKISA